ncbi:MAG TPA: hypothetical protein VFJ09_13815 [Nocardioidaceae bacterium]|nr:hypothetical protein [Nocardioidaceae bacterium]
MTNDEALMNSVTMMALVVLFPVACLLGLLGLGWLEENLERGLKADAKRVRRAAQRPPIVEMPMRRAEPAAETPRRLQPSRAAS